jgi:hypothetical protein
MQSLLPRKALGRHPPSTAAVPNARRVQPRRSIFVKAQQLPEALLFDCDGVLVDTERDGHRISFNEAFKRKGSDVRPSVRRRSVPLGTERPR